MRRIWLLLAALWLVPTAAADDPPQCLAVTDAPPNPAGLYTYGDVVRGLELWLESNVHPGLQRQPCLRDDGTLAGPDTLITATFFL